jgi:hypothetical protein
MIAILIRRNARVGDPTTDFLFAQDGPLYLRIKPEFLDQPVFIAAAPGVRELNQGSLPAASRSLTANMKRRALVLRYPENSSFYSWKRGFAANVKRATYADTS